MQLHVWSIEEITTFRSNYEKKSRELKHEKKGYFRIITHMLFKTLSKT